MNPRARYRDEFLGGEPPAPHHPPLTTHHSPLVTTVCRLLPYSVAGGPHNMAADEAMLESALAGTPSLRFYGWSEATLSLGYFQPERLRRTDPHLANLPFVRRPTGGGALVHHRELTYALALPPGRPWQTGKDQHWLSRWHQIIASALAAQGVTSSAVSGQPQQAFDGFLCFQHLTPGDLLVDTVKIVGSAQRRQRGALLQHGSLLLAASPYTPLLPGVQELSGRNFPIPEICSAIQCEFARQTEWRLVPGDWTNSERWRIEELAAQKYMSPAWNQKR